MNDELFIYAVFDLKAKIYDVPFFSRNSHLAARRFILDVRNRETNSVLAGFKDEFELHCLGSYSQTTGKLTGEITVIQTGKAVEL